MQFTTLPEYELLIEDDIADINSKGYLLRHKKSGARIMVIANDDENKVFHIAFRTPPKDSTGVAHILEHSVLCGSEKFPSKDPFVELVKGSLNTFLNAMTYPDKTMYPVASCNDQDFRNLMHVYMDAVFHTNIYNKEEIFRQEGWNYHLESPEDELTYNGVVYNEMKGAFSSPDDVLDREILNSLFPDTPYGNESGGDPAFIPDLTYQDFLEFHRKYYHPSNSYIYLYGNADMEERLKWLDEEYLEKYDAIQVDSAIPMQKPFERPVEIKKKYSISNTEEEKDNTFLSYNVAIKTSLDVQLANAFSVIEYALLTAPGAPLKQALLDAKIGKDIQGSYDSGVYQPIFSVVAKNSNTDSKDRFLEIIQDVLKQTVKDGIDKKALLAGINNMEFKFREADYGTYPKGLMYGIDAMDSWLYDDAAPFDYLKQLDIFKFLKDQTETDYFEKLIQEYLLDNTHASVVIVEPQKGLTAIIEQDIKKKLKEYKESLSPEEIQELTDKTEKLRLFQETPSTKEELEAIPVLEASDIKREAGKFYNEEHFLGDTIVLHHNMYTNGIGYLKLLFDTKYVPLEYIPYLGILKAVLGMVDTQHFSYGELFNEINIHSGGIYPGIEMFVADKQGGCRTMFEIKAKILYEKLDFAFDMIEEMIFTSKIEDEKRLYEIIAEIKSRVSVRLNSAGHSTAAIRSMSYFSQTSAFNDAVSGIRFYKLVESLEVHFDEKKEELIRILKELMKMIFRKDTLLGSYTADDAGFAPLLERLSVLKEKLFEETGVTPHGKLETEQKNEGFQTSSKIQYVARAGNFVQAGLKYTGVLKILKVVLSYEYLWVNIRVKGGAYGCMSGFGKTGDSYFVSYRDPNLRKTNEVYEGVVDYVRNFTVADRDMTKYIIGTISEMDTPLNPSAKGSRSLGAYISNMTEEDLQKERDEVLNATQEDVRALWKIMEAIVAADNICVIGNEEKLAEEKDMFKVLVPFIG